MEAFEKNFPSRDLAWPASPGWALAGVVGSGNLEVLIEPLPASPGSVSYAVETSVAGYADTWASVLEDFAHHYAIGGTKITIHDQGAAPIVVTMRLRQALAQVASL